MRNTTILLLSLLVSIFAVSCKKTTTYSLTLSKSSIAFTAEGGTDFFSITTDADSWTIEPADVDWLTISSTSGNGPKAMITLQTKGLVAEPKSVVLVVRSGSERAEIAVSQASSDYIYTLTGTMTQTVFTELQQSATLRINGNVPAWTATTNAAWIHLDESAGTTTPKDLTVTIDANADGAQRVDSIVIAGDGAKTVVLVLTQNSALFPSYNTNPIPADQSGMTHTASQIAASMFLGWNLGNSLEAIGGETAWGNAAASQRLIDSIAATGVNAIRIPCSWNGYANQTTAEISATWLARVKQVVDYCINRNIYVTLNIHWDGGWLENNITVAKQYENNAKQRAFWEQIATYFRNYDEHLLFAGCNEPAAEDATQMSVLLSYEQTFIDAVRSTGGRNAYRALIVQGPVTDIEKTETLMNTLPTDAATSRLMVEVHYYTPYQFCLMESDQSWGNMAYFWGAGNHYAGTIDGVDRNASWGEEADMNTLFNKMKTKFVNRGIPVILGEYCASRRTTIPADALPLHNQSRDAFHRIATRQAKIHGLVPFYWDNGGNGNLASGIFNRSTGVVVDRRTVDALVEGATAGNYPF